MQHAWLELDGGIWHMLARNPADPGGQGHCALDVGSGRVAYCRAASGTLCWGNPKSRFFGYALTRVIH